ncbi:LysE family transporter [Cognatiyoonia sp. IB215446]|uniref:LysE family translocator n=1 Tax=Cognatiyoonia sp. IB215446 TaxID=3097355 RepID=UPI002A14F5EC|nr:LysE family transporter [Cognatiyoonia sp. IB215446]MDX8348748.1 LysE family transporter [Cognatiyoonia sp. IB215446]
MTWAAILTLAGLQALIAISPGPAAVVTIKTAASQGVKAGLALSFGLASAILIWASAALAGLSIVFEVAPYLQTSLRVAGGLFLIWIGWSMWRHARTPLPDPVAAPAIGAARLVRLGLLTNLANPKALAYFAAVFVGIMPADPTFAMALTILTVIFVIEFAWYAALSIAFSRPSPRRAYQRGKMHIDRAFGGILALLGARIAYN